MSEIGTPIDQSQIANAQLIVKNGFLIDVEKEASEIIEKELEKYACFLNGTSCREATNLLKVQF